MRSIRWRLTFAYAVALAVTLTAFGTTLYITRQQTGLRSLQDRLHLEAELSAQYLTNSYGVLGRIVTDDPPRIEASIAPYFESIRDFFILADSAGRALYLSDSVSILPFASIERLRALLYPPPRAQTSGSFVFDPAVGPTTYLVYPVTQAGPEVSAILVAAPSKTTLVEADELLASMVVIAPLILIASILVGYWVAGRNLQPLRAMVSELEAITDSRSLHRRLAVERTGDEVDRLGHAVNQIGRAHV